MSEEEESLGSVDSSESEVVGVADRVLANEMVGAASSEAFSLSSAWP